MTSVVFGEFEVDVESLPEVSVQALLTRGFAHLLSNEAASKLSAKIKSRIAERDGKKTALVTSGEISRWRKENEEEVAGLTQGIREEFFAALVEGTIGQKQPSRKVESPESQRMAKIAWQEIKAVLRNKGIKIPRGQETIKFSNGQEFGKKELIARRLGKEEHRERIQAMVQEQLAGIAGAVGEDLGL